MVAEARAFPVDARGAPGPFRVGVTSAMAPLPAWKQKADFLFVQVGFSIERLVEWRASIEFGGPVFAGVLVVASAAMARKLSSEVAELAVPEELISLVDRDSEAGVEAGCSLVCAIRDSGRFDGVHLIPVSRYRDVASRLERLL